MTVGKIEIPQLRVVRCCEEEHSNMWTAVSQDEVKVDNGGIEQWRYGTLEV